MAKRFTCPEQPRSKKEAGRNLKNALEVPPRSIPVFFLALLETGAGFLITVCRAWSSLVCVSARGNDFCVHCAYIPEIGDANVQMFRLGSRLRAFS